MESSFHPLCEYVSENKDSANRKEPICTSLILSNPGPFTVGGKDKRRKEKAKQQTVVSFSLDPRSTDP